MERFQRVYSVNKSIVDVQILDPVGTGWDEHRTLQLSFDNGLRFMANFWLDPMKRGSHWWEEAGMGIVVNLATETILIMVDEVLQRGAVEGSFVPMPENHDKG
jgi:hypothetical protein